MLATLLNAPARPLLTGLVLLVVSMTLLAVLSLAFPTGGATRREPSAPERPAFTRRLITLPPVVVTASDAVVTSTQSRVR